MSGSGIRRSPMGGSSSARDAASGSGQAAVPSETDSVRRSSATITPHGIPQRQAGRSSATQAASALPPRTTLPPRDSAADVTLGAADRECIARLEALGTRVNRTLALIEGSSDSAQKRRLLVSAYKALKEILSTHERLSPAVRAPAKPLSSALDVVNALVSTLSDDVLMNALQDHMHQPIGPGDPIAARERLRVTQRLKQLAEQSREIQDYKQFMQALSKLPGVRDSSNAVGSIREQADSGIRRAMMVAVVTASGALWSHYMRLSTYEPPAALQGALDEIQQLLGEAAELNTPLQETGPDAAQEGYRQAREHLQVVGKICRASDRFAQAAAEDWSAEGGESERWEHALELADALPIFTSAVIEQVEEEARVRGAMIASAVEPYGTDGASTPSTSAPSTTDAASDCSAGTGRSRRSRSNRRRPVEDSAALPAVATTDPRELALKKANGLLRSHPLTREMVQRSNADVRSIARDCRKDIGALEAMISGGHEVHSIAHMARESMRSWFGDAKPLLQARDEMSSLLQAGVADDAIQACIAQLGERIEALDLVNRQIHADEADALKGLEFPRAQHLQRMLELDEIDRVVAPVKLDSADDKDNLGKLFELRIQPKALSDGSHAAPLFLHMHASKLMSAEQAMTLPFDQFTAVHVKTGKQKNLGARWEEIQQRLGNFDARVHRGKVDSALLNQLRCKVAGPASAR